MLELHLVSFYHKSNFIKKTKKSDNYLFISNSNEIYCKGILFD